MSKSKRTKTHANDIPTTLLIRDVPPEIFAGLDEWIEELEGRSDAQAKYSRPGVALKAIREVLEARKVAKTK